LTKSAAADFRLCNNTGSRVGVAIGYKDAEAWTTEGWEILRRSARRRRFELRNPDPGYLFELTGKPSKPMTLFGLPDG
jgi:hypothetical protein